MSVRLLLTELVSEAFASAGYSSEYGQVTVSNRPDLCQFQCNGAMAAARQYRKAPLVIASDVVRRLEGDSRFAAVSAVAPGFINLTLQDAFLAQLIRDMAADSRLLLPTLEKETIVVDFGRPERGQAFAWWATCVPPSWATACAAWPVPGQGRDRRRPSR